jgi:tungstate transport system substrate-binding protein
MRFRYAFMRVTMRWRRDAARPIILAMFSRRRLLVASLCGVGLDQVPAQQRRSLNDPLRLGVDDALYDSGLAKALQHAFGADTGVAVQLVRGPALTLLDSLERGEFDAALANAPDAEAQLEKQGLVHDRQSIAGGEFVIVGPSVRGKAGDSVGVAAAQTAAQALARLRDAALAAPGTITFVSAGNGSGTHALEQALWREAKIAPAPPWYVAAEPNSTLVGQARARGAYALVEKGAWIAQGGAPLAVLVHGDAQLRETVHVMRSFRVNHPAGKIFVAWIAGPKGRRVVAAQRGYSVTSA